MNELKRLYKQYENKLKQLQKTCERKHMADWIRESTDGNHLTLHKVTCFERCNKLMKRKELTKEELKGLGKLPKKFVEPA